MIAVLSQRFARTFVQPKWKRPEPLANVLPRQVVGWSSTDLGLGETEGQSSAVEQTLNFSEAVFRRYQRDNDEVSVYIAYWEPGRNHPRLISDHIPDNCWVRVGWQLRSASYSWQLPMGSIKLKPAQYRVFSKFGTAQYVAYWHLVDGELSAFSNLTTGRPRSFYEDWHMNPIQLQGEQYFVRLSSNRPLDVFCGDAGFNSIIASILPSGLLEHDGSKQGDPMR